MPEQPRRWRWSPCPQCFNSRAGKAPGGGRITGALVWSATVTATTGDAITGVTRMETWRLTCPCGHVWEVTRDVPQPSAR